MTSFAVIDFETAASSWSSACAVGAVIVRNGEVTAKKSMLIRPPGNRYDDFNIAIHGITPDQTRKAGTIDKVWPGMAEFIGKRLVLAHNAPFDVHVLRYSAAKRRYTPPAIHFACSCRLARETWPSRENHKLKDLSEFLGIPLDHHDPASDANAAAELTLAVLKRHKAKTVREVSKQLGFSIGKLDGNDYEPFSNSASWQWS